MGQVWNDDKVVPVTLVEAGPVTVAQVKTKSRDGYDAVQVGFGKRKRLTKPIGGHVKGLGNLRYIREFRLGSAVNSQVPKMNRGDIVDVSVFQEGDRVSVSGISKGRGFQGVVKRHGFHGGPKTHGQKNRYRAPGSIGSTAPQRVLPGRKMAGHMGVERVTVKNLEVAKVDKDKNLLFLKGAVPGNRGSLLEIRGG